MVYLEVQLRGFVGGNVGRVRGGKFGPFPAPLSRVTFSGLLNGGVSRVGFNSEQVRFALTFDFRLWGRWDSCGARWMRVPRDVTPRATSRRGDEI